MIKKIQWVMDWLKEREVSDEMKLAIHETLHWVTCGIFNKYYTSKNTRIKEWNPEEKVITKTVSKILAVSMVHSKGMTYQAMIGFISGSIGCKDTLDRAKCAAEIIALCFRAGLIAIIKERDSYVIYPQFELDEDIPEFTQHVPEFKKPLITRNTILGNRFKQHDKEICMDHIQRLNSTKLCLNWRVIDNVEEVATSEIETEEQQTAWNDFYRRSNEMYQLIGKKNFYLKHNYDTRGRCYCEGYYVNYQGSSFKKSIVQLADKEIIK